MNKTHIQGADLSFAELMAAAKSGFIPINHGGTFAERLNRLPEVVYIDLWRQTNERWNTLEKILRRVPTQAEADVAADVIQWLGTAIGLAFVREAESKIAQSRGS